jgi:hypothetical protein
MLNGLMNERVVLIKKNGERFENLPANVQRNLIITNDPKIPIEDGDQFERRTPSNVIEVFDIVDAGFIQPFHSMTGHYQSKVRKATARPPSTQAQQIIYNLNGPNARVNIQSSDSSTNVVNVESAALFDKMRSAMQESINNVDKLRHLSERIDAMQDAAGTKSFLDRYQEFISFAADHLTVFAPFLPALSQLIS